MFSNLCDLRKYIDRELVNSSSALSQMDREKLRSIVEAFLKNEISYNIAINIFAECSVPSSLITKFAHIKAVGDNRLFMVDKEKTFLFPTRKKAVAWSPEEDLRLTRAVEKFGSRDWRIIAAFVGSGRTSSQCNQRWTRALNPAIKHNPWTSQEDEKLIEIVEQKGCGKWRKIAGYLPGRTDLQCRHRYLQLKKKPEELDRFDPRRLDIELLLNK